LQFGPQQVILSTPSSSPEGDVMHKVASNRSFGLLLCAILLMVTLTGYLTRGQISLWWGALTAIFLTASLLTPRVLAPVKRLWLKLGAVIYVVVGPIALGLIYIIVMVPVGILIRLLGKDPLSLKHDPSTPSYWITRDIGSPAPKSLRDQF
jgi:hypothetical protein